MLQVIVVKLYLNGNEDLILNFIYKVIEYDTELYAFFEGAPKIKTLDELLTFISLRRSFVNHKRFVLVLLFLFSAMISGILKQ